MVTFSRSQPVQNDSPSPVSILAVGTVAFDSIDTPFGSAERVLGGSPPT